MVDEREVITKETVKKALLREIKSEIIACIVDTIFSVWIPFLCVLCILTTTFKSWDAIVFCGIAPALAAVFVLFMLGIEWYRVLSHLNIIKKDDFAIVEDTLKNISEDEMHSEVFRLTRFRVKGAGRYVIDDAFYFSNYGRVYVAKNISAYSMSGDVFYLAVIPRKNDEVMKLYNSRIYRYEK